jgi:fructose-bisphosphate aldolase, class I
MNLSELKETARAMVAPGKGILAADESLRSTEKRFHSHNIPHTEENRHLYRDWMFTTPGLEAYITGVIMYDESIRQRTHDNVPFAEFLANKGIIPGIKVDKGPVEMANFPGEKVTEGLDGLAQRLNEYRAMGARFAKWRAVISIGDGLPSRQCIRENALLLARYAAICQESGIVPIVEPEVLMEGSHSLERDEEVTREVLSEVFYQLNEQRVELEAMVLKPNMVLPGKDSPKQAAPEAAAEATLRVLYQTVPPAVPGIAFLSGGQGPKASVDNLRAIAQHSPHPWQVTYSFLRGMIDPAFDVWMGKDSNTAHAQQVFLQQARLTASARSGAGEPVVSE